MNKISEPKTCLLCENPADIETWDSGKRLIFYCSGVCPTFQITRRAIKELEMKPALKPYVLQKVKAFANENLNDMPVIRMILGSTELQVTTRSRERDDRN